MSVAASSTSLQKINEKHYFLGVIPLVKNCFDVEFDFLAYMKFISPISVREFTRFCGKIFFISH